MSDFYCHSVRWKFFSGSQTALFLHFSGIIFSCCSKGTTAYWLKKIKNRDTKNKPLGYHLRMQCEVKAEYNL